MPLQSEGVTLEGFPWAQGEIHLVQRDAGGLVLTHADDGGGGNGVGVIGDRVRGDRLGGGRQGLAGRSGGLVRNGGRWLLGAVELGIDDGKHNDQRGDDDNQGAQEGDKPGPVHLEVVEGAGGLFRQTLAALGAGGEVGVLGLVVEQVLSVEDIAVVRVAPASARGGGRTGGGRILRAAEGASAIGGAVVLTADGAVD